MLKGLPRESPFVLTKVSREQKGCDVFSTSASWSWSILGSLGAEPGPTDLLRELAKHETPAKSNTGLVSPAAGRCGVTNKNTKHMKCAWLASLGIRRVTVCSWQTLVDLKKTISRTTTLTDVSWWRFLISFSWFSFYLQLLLCWDAKYPLVVATCRWRQCVTAGALKRNRKTFCHLQDASQLWIHGWCPAVVR